MFYRVLKTYVWVSKHFGIHIVNMTDLFKVNQNTSLLRNQSFKKGRCVSSVNINKYNGSYNDPLMPEHVGDIDVIHSEWRIMINAAFGLYNVL